MFYFKDSEFMAWCGKFGCDANEQTKAVFDSYMGQFLIQDKQLLRHSPGQFIGTIRRG